MRTKRIISAITSLTLICGICTACGDTAGNTSDIASDESSQTVTESSTEETAAESVSEESEAKSEEVSEFEETSEETESVTESVSSETEAETTSEKSETEVSEEPADTTIVLPDTSRYDGLNSALACFMVLLEYNNVEIDFDDFVAQLEVAEKPSDWNNDYPWEDPARAFVGDPKSNWTENYGIYSMTLLNSIENYYGSYIFEFVPDYDFESGLEIVKKGTPVFIEATRNLEAPIESGVMDMSWRYTNSECYLIIGCTDDTVTVYDPYNDNCIHEYDREQFKESFSISHSVVGIAYINKQ